MKPYHLLGLQLDYIKSVFNWSLILLSYMQNSIDYVVRLLSNNRLITTITVLNKISSRKKNNIIIIE